MNRKRTIHVEQLLGRRVRARGGHVVGRIEEIRVEVRDGEWEITEYLLGTGALIERLGIIGRLFGRRRTTLIARWNQIDVGRPSRPALTCDTSEIRIEKPRRKVSNTHENG